MACLSRTICQLSSREEKERGEGRTYNKSTSNLLGRNLRLVDGDVGRECADSKTGDEPSHHELLPGVEGGHLREERVKLESQSRECKRKRRTAHLDDYADGDDSSG